MTDKELDEFRHYAEHLDASFDEYQMLIGLLVRLAAQEYHFTEIQDEL